MPTLERSGAASKDRTAGAGAKPRAEPPEAARTLPGWAYCSAELHRREVERVHLPAWQFLCHQSELPGPGDYVSLDLLGRRIFAVRGEDGQIRAFHNVCPHRAHAVVTGPRGTCAGSIRCPYHAWTFGLDGRLSVAASPRSFPPFEAAEYGLKPVETEVWMGLVLFRLRPGGPSLGQRLAEQAPHIAPYRLADMRPIGAPWGDVMAGDWKNVVDNYLECYHCPIGHPGLSCLMSPDYANLPDEASRSARFFHDLREKPVRGWAQKRYNAVVPDFAHLPAELKRRWGYLFVYPGITLNFYLDMLNVMVVRPLGPGRSWVGGRNYALPDAGRAARAARWLCLRINGEVQREDIALVTSVQRGLESGAYGRGLLSDKELGVRAFHGWLKADLPEVLGEPV